jgi:hypothetical protein
VDGEGGGPRTTHACAPLDRHEPFRGGRHLPSGEPGGPAGPPSPREQRTGDGASLNQSSPPPCSQPASRPRRKKRSKTNPRRTPEELTRAHYGAALASAVLSFFVTDWPLTAEKRCTSPAAWRAPQRRGPAPATSPEYRPRATTSVVGVSRRWRAYSGELLKWLTPSPSPAPPGRAHRRVGV